MIIGGCYYWLTKLSDLSLSGTRNIQTVWHKSVTQKFSFLSFFMGDLR